MTFGVNLIVRLEILNSIFRGSNEPPSGFFCKKSLHIKNSVSFLDNKTLLSQKTNCFVPFFAVYK